MEIVGQQPVRIGATYHQISHWPPSRAAARRYNWGSCVSTVMTLERLAGVSYSSTERAPGATVDGILTVRDFLPPDWARVDVRVPLGGDTWATVAVERIGDSKAKRVTVSGNPFGALALQPGACIASASHEYGHPPPPALPCHDVPSHTYTTTGMGAYCHHGGALSHVRVSHTLSRARTHARTHARSPRLQAPRQGTAHRLQDREIGRQNQMALRGRCGPGSQRHGGVGVS